MGAPRLELADISKSFGGVHALKAARLELRPGEVHGLVGENGAGKSTLINIATGVLRPDAGTIRVAGAEVHIHTPRQAVAHGIAVVHQEADLFAQLSLAENMLLRRGLVRNALGLIRWPATYRAAKDMVAAMGEAFDVRAPASGLSVARRMMAEIAAAVSEDAQVLFLDEPTASLTTKEIDALFAQIRRLRDRGVGIVYVSHRLDEILALCDRVTVMRDGETVETQPVRDMTLDRIVSAMVGREMNEMFAKRTVPIGATRLRVEGAASRDGAFSGVSLEVRTGEIVGLYGFVGAGRSELGQALFGMRPLAQGRVTVDGAAPKLDSPRHAVRAGLAYLPEDRLVQGIFRGHSLRTNASVATLRRLSRLGIVNGAAERALAERVVRDMNVRAHSIEQPIGTLSGGNQQKVVFGRWQAAAPKVLILDEPTRGVDVGAKAEIHRIVCKLAEQGTAILMISSELPEIMAMSDRVVTMAEGRLTGEFDPRADGEEVIARAAVPKATAEPVAAARRPGLWGRVAAMRELGLLCFILFLAGGMALARPAEFANLQNFFDILVFAAFPAILAQGAMLIICSGGIDISIGSMMGLVGAVAAMAAKAGWPPGLCFGVATALGALCGLANGGTALLARIHPIIVTLAGISIYRGIMRIVTSGREVLQLPEAYKALGDGTLLGMPKIVVFLALVTAITHILLRYTLLGRQTLALGNSESAARLIGLSKAKLTLFAFGFSGALVGMTSVWHAGYYAGVQANTGEGMELKAIAAAVIGGTNILGGRGSALGTLLGAFLVALLYNMLVLAKISSYWQEVFVGGLILSAVVIDMLLQRRQGGAA